MKVLYLFLILFISFLIQAYSAHAELLSLKPGITTTPGIKFEVPYSLGVIKGEVLMLGGKILIDTDNPIGSNGIFKVPIDSLYTSKPMRDCHIKEALGLDYDHSDYPVEHVCSEKFQLPFDGKNAMAYPIISFKIDSLQSINQSKQIQFKNESIATNVEVFGEWNLHGKSRQTHFPLKIYKTGKTVKISGETFISLKDFDVVIKTPKVLLIPLKVEDKVKIIFDMILE